MDDADEEAAAAKGNKAVGKDLAGGFHPGRREVPSNVGPGSPKLRRYDAPPPPRTVVSQQEQA